MTLRRVITHFADFTRERSFVRVLRSRRISIFQNLRDELPKTRSRSPDILDVGGMESYLELNGPEIFE